MELVEEENERQRHIFMAKLAEQAERYDEMVDYMKKVARMDMELTSEERNLLSVGYKNVIGARRASWRILSSLVQQENERNLKIIIYYMKRVEDEHAKICNDILSIIAIHLLPSSTTGESVVFFYKMPSSTETLYGSLRELLSKINMNFSKGDYYRYLAEFKTGEQKQEAANQSLKAYQAATSAAMTELPPANPVRLGLALNFSVFYYEILNMPERACHLAQQAFEAAMTEFDTLNEESSKDSTLIMQLLKDNLTLWTWDFPKENDEQSKETSMDMEE